MYTKKTRNSEHKKSLCQKKSQPGPDGTGVRKFKSRPNVDKRTPDVWINVHLDRQRATLSIDTSGGSLHKRGYRQKSVDAPMQETVAAAILHISQWDGSRPLYDPMCGSGTLLTEALMRVSKIPAGFLRKRFGFENSWI